MPPQDFTPFRVGKHTVHFVESDFLEEMSHRERVKAYQQLQQLTEAKPLLQPVPFEKMEGDECCILVNETLGFRVKKMSIHKKRPYTYVVANDQGEKIRLHFTPMKLR